MLEKDFQVRFGHWLKATKRKTCAFELKSSRGNSLPFAALADHQESALYLAKHGTLVFKIPDAGYQNPFDGFCLTKVPAWVVVRFESGKIYGIDIDEWMAEQKRFTRKSLTEERAKVIHSFEVA